MLDAAGDPAARDPVAAGHFTTMQLRGGRVQGRDLHLLRLRAASGELWGAGPDEAVLRRRVREGVARAGAADGTLRVRVTPAAAGAAAGGGAVVHPPFGYELPGRGDPVRRPLRIDVEIGPPRVVPEAPLRVRCHHGLRACPGLKHLALEPQFALRRDARAAGWDDVLLLAPDGAIAEGSFWNIALWDGEAVSWPLAPALPGVTRCLLQGALDGAGIPQREVPVRAGELVRQQAAFAVNSSGIREIGTVDDHRFPGDPGFGARLRALLAAVPWDAL